MLAVVKMPHTKNTKFSVVGKIDKETMNFLTGRFGEENVTIDEEIVDIVNGDWFKGMSKKVTPGKVVRIYRENLDLTQEQLAKKTGVQKATYISDIENGRRPISKKLTIKFADIFDVSPEMFF